MLEVASGSGSARRPGTAGGTPMHHSFGYWAVHVLQIMFFVGLIGCTSTVLLSWIKILRSILSDKD
jgi:hypothetical protein